jgi:hypothetical protein
VTLLSRRVPDRSILILKPFDAEVFVATIPISLG